MRRVTFRWEKPFLTGSKHGDMGKVILAPQPHVIYEHCSQDRPHEDDKERHPTKDEHRGRKRVSLKLCGICGVISAKNGGSNVEWESRTMRNSGVLG